jgi:sialic acid synthase SpsE
MLRTIRIDFPALDRLIDFLEAAQQAEVDLAKSQIQQATERLTKSREKLGQIAKENPL